MSRLVYWVPKYGVRKPGKPAFVYIDILKKEEIKTSLPNMEGPCDLRSTWASKQDGNMDRPNTTCRITVEKNECEGLGINEIVQQE